MEAKSETVDELPDPDLKIILLGDSAVGKSKLIERYLMDEYNPRQVCFVLSRLMELIYIKLSTYALTLFRKEIKLKEDDGKSTIIGK